jgi:hypothetical protein
MEITGENNTREKGEKSYSPYLSVLMANAKNYFSTHLGQFEN